MKTVGTVSWEWVADNTALKHGVNNFGEAWAPIEGVKFQYLQVFSLTPNFS
jgi:hypothetical protein